MFDRHLIVATEKTLLPFAKLLVSRKISANRITIYGFSIGLFGLLCISQNLYIIGLIFILLNRVCDGLDGLVARLTSPSDFGAFLDITLDFMFYALVPLSFVWSDPNQNSLPGIILVVSFFGTGCSFLAFSIFAERNQLHSEDFPKKGIHFFESFMEGGETIFFFCLMCLFPHFFPYIAYFFSFLCILTWISRIKTSFVMFKE
ncbi:MAG: CDP-alcohol phosphatidyltransferase family protein [Paracoccaceae bacterium]|nr:CDP-alcohol phosphatidyltransferase family protein [Paracoccaceae bacterium]